MNTLDVELLSKYLAPNATVRNISSTRSKSAVHKRIRNIITSSEISESLKVQILEHINHNISVRHIHGGMVTCAKHKSQKNQKPETVFERLSEIKTDRNYINAVMHRFFG